MPPLALLLSVPQYSGSLSIVADYIPARMLPVLCSYAAHLLLIFCPSPVSLLFLLTLPLHHNLLICFPCVYVIGCQFISYFDCNHFLAVMFKNASSTFIACHLHQFWKQTGIEEDWI